MTKAELTLYVGRQFEMSSPNDFIDAPEVISAIMSVATYVEDNFMNLSGNLSGLASLTGENRFSGNIFSTGHIYADEVDIDTLQLGRGNFDNITVIDYFQYNHSTQAEGKFLRNSDGHGNSDWSFVSFASLTGKPSTLGGYGITDAYPLTGNPSGFITSSAVASTYATQASLALKSNLASPSFTGTVTLPITSIQQATVGLGGGASLTNVAFGFGTLFSNTTGTNNVAIGNQASGLNVGGSDNTIVGQRANQNNVSGIENTALGKDALFNNKGNGNIAIGKNAAFGTANNTSSNNVAIGKNTLQIINGGSDNTVVGYNSSNTLADGSNNVIVGSNNTGIAGNVNNSTVVGSYINLSSLGSNQIIIADGAGNQRINVNSSGNVGIGIQNAEFKLHVVGYIRSTGLQVTSVDLLGQADAGTNNSKISIANQGFGADSRLTFTQSNYLQGAGWQNGEDILNVHGAYFGFAGNSNPQATIDLGTSGTLKIGNLAGAGKVLTSDANGYASWATLASSGGTFASLTGKPTTLSGYGITDAVSLSASQVFSGATNSFTNALLVGTNTNTGEKLQVTGTSKLSGFVKIATSAFNDSAVPLIIGAAPGASGGSDGAKIAIASASNYQDIMFVNTSIASGSINCWTFGQRQDTAFGNSFGAFLIIGAYQANTGYGVGVGGGYRVPLICNPNGDVILAGASANAINGKVGIGTTTPTSKLQVVGLPLYADNTTAIAGGLTAGAFYRTSAGVLMITV